METMKIVKKIVATQMKINHTYINKYKYKYLQNTFHRSISLQKDDLAGYISMTDDSARG